MNHPAKPSRPLFSAFAALGGALLLAACGANAPAAEPERPPLEGASIGGDFQLVDTAGKQVGWGDFAGKYRIVYFGYAFCPDICPNDMSQTARALAELRKTDPAKVAKIQPIFITIDPERDTPEVIDQFTRAFSDDFVGLTGTPEQVAAAAKTFAVYAAKGEDVGGGQYLMDHSNIVYLFGPSGEPLATLPVDQGPEAVAAEIDKWVS